MSRLRQLYEEQEKIDSEILELFEKRVQNSEEISDYKIEEGGKLIDKAADREEIKKLSSGMHTDFTRIGSERLLSMLMSISRERQYQILEEKGIGGRPPFTEVEQLPKKNVRVVFQGVEGAYSHAAMCEFFGREVNSFHVDKFRDAMESIADGEADYAVLPIENSSAGIVADNMDLLVNFENYIVAEQVIRCEHVLMGLPGTKIEEIKQVYSHQQALSQCERFLDQYDWERIPYANTAMAARKVARDGIKSQAAIGSAFAAERFGLEVLKEHVYYNEANSTRFIIVTSQRIFQKDAKKISICFELPHTSGALFSITSHLIYNHLNMTMIESRPIPGRNWEYRIFIDFEGNLNQSNVRSALRGIRSDAINMKILGNY